MENKNVPPLIHQNCLYKLGAYMSERLSIDLYYLVETIYHLIPVYGEESLEKNYPDYKYVKKKLYKLNKLLSKSKLFYDSLQDKNFKTKFKDLDKFQKFIKKQFNECSSKIPAIQLDIYNLFYYLVSNCSIKHQNVRTDMLKILEYRDNVKIDAKKSKEVNPLSK